ncbi:activating transcription factor 4b [Menidia menidia]
MTMMMTNSQFGLEDMEALLWEPSSPMADVMGSLFVNPDIDGQQEGGGTLLQGDTSPVSPLASSSPSSSSSPPPFYSPPPSPPDVLLHGDKAGTESELLPFTLLGHSDQLRGRQMPSDDKEDAVIDLDWMAERVDLSEFDLDSLIGSCSPAEESPTSPEELLASLDCSMELEPFPLPTLQTPVLPSLPSASYPSAPSPALSSDCPDPSVITVDEPESCVDGQEVPLSLLSVPEPQEELEIKSEPASPDPPPPVVHSASSPVFTLDLGSEVDVAESDVKPVVATVVPQVPRIVLSLSPTRIVLVLSPKNKASEVVRCPPPASPPQSSPRSRPYPELKHGATPPANHEAKAERPTLKAPRDKKHKKMEQNKTAATRYRQKKRAEQDALLVEHAQLEKKNVELTEKAESMAREIEYLKELMEEVRQAKLRKGLGADPQWLDLVAVDGGR